MIFPERILFEITKYFVECTVENFHEVTDKTQSYLYELFGSEPNFLNYNYFDNAVAIFSREKDHPRHIEVHMSLNQNRFSLPTIHINLPGEQVSNVNGMGYDFGYLADQYQPDDPYMLATTGSRMFRSKYNIVFTSDNTFEVLIMYQWFKSCMIGNIELFEAAGMQNCIISGNDIVLDDHTAPPAIYSRAIGIDCIYEITAPNFNKYQLPKKLIIKRGKLIE